MTSPQLTYYNMNARVVAFSSTRQGGCSTGNYAAFNVNAYCGDSDEHIAQNRA
ncbi:MAG: laccase domain-containing protein, partial [Prevotella sp.]|nr:laccase domain-containing protein [Prevotella sp.]